jgi:hypothetical protein
MSTDSLRLYDAFLSYADADRAWVETWLLPRLADVGLRISTSNDFALGVPYLINVERAVLSSQHTLVVLTPAWVESQWQQFDAILAQTLDPTAREQRTLPLLLQPCQPPLRLAALTYADFTHPSRRERQLRHIIALLRGEP